MKTHPTIVGKIKNYQEISILFSINLIYIKGPSMDLEEAEIKSERTDAKQIKD